jgi:hypothetical protein
VGTPGFAGVATPDRLWACRVVADDCPAGKGRLNFEETAFACLTAIVGG